MPAFTCARELVDLLQACPVNVGVLELEHILHAVVVVEGSGCNTKTQCRPDSVQDRLGKGNKVSNESP